MVEQKVDIGERDLCAEGKGDDDAGGKPGNQGEWGRDLVKRGVARVMCAQTAIGKEREIVETFIKVFQIMRCIDDEKESKKMIEDVVQGLNVGVLRTSVRKAIKEMKVNFGSEVKSRKLIDEGWVGKQEEKKREVMVCLLNKMQAQVRTCEFNVRVIGSKNGALAAAIEQLRKELREEARQSRLDLKKEMVEFMLEVLQTQRSSKRPSKKERREQRGKGGGEAGVEVAKGGGAETEGRGESESREESGSGRGGRERDVSDDPGEDEDLEDRVVRLLKENMEKLVFLKFRDTDYVMTTVDQRNFAKQMDTIKFRHYNFDLRSRDWECEDGQWVRQISSLRIGQFIREFTETMYGPVTKVDFCEVQEGILEVLRIVDRECGILGEEPPTAGLWRKSLRGAGAGKSGGGKRPKWGELRL